MSDHVTHIPGGCLRHYSRHMHDGLLEWSFDCAEQVAYWGC